jgi:dTDP-4-amino-4,6-dideoxygalactose transaminase
MDEIVALTKANNLLLVEDSAQALGSKFRGQFAGTFGSAGVFSFYPAKILGCFGDGGAVVTNEDEVAARVRLLRDHGRDEVGEVRMWGLNSRLDNLQAAILHFQFKDYQRIIDHRRLLAAAYTEHLGGLAELVLPPAPDADPDHYDVYQNYEIEAERRDALREYLKKCGIGTIIQWGGKAVHQFRDLGFNTALPATDRLFERCLTLPMNMVVTTDDVAYIAHHIRAFYGR